MNILELRAEKIGLIRRYFAGESVLEVDTPLLRPHTVTDPYMRAGRLVNPDGKTRGYLQTSPEYAMKELLSRGSGDIYQLGKVFRADENGPHHSTEFTMLEWYRIGWSFPRLMDEVYQIVELVAGKRKRVDLTYREAFLTHLKIDPFEISAEELAIFAQEKLGALPNNMLKDNYLTLIFSSLIEPRFESSVVTFVYDFPASQASLAKTRDVEGEVVASRFEAYSGGLELANGFEELVDPAEQLKRFNEDNKIRESLGYKKQSIDMGLIGALEKGLPQCSGVAVGVDRLLMLSRQSENITDILPMSFNLENL